MTIIEIATNIANALYDQWTYDMEVLATPWVHWTVLPALCYIVFMVFKWSVMTLPFWLPIRLAFTRVKHSPKNCHQPREERKVLT